MAGFLEFVGPGEDVRTAVLVESIQSDGSAHIGKVNTADFSVMACTGVRLLR
ncbi:hypothetical protein Cs7R123_10920 [Catellatospora sp. TT07R-123]|nr:hypothetical protein Cs7R123_10920 [Catellatospora sp. TT07R-123]